MQNSLRTIIASISFTVLTDRHGNASAVWLLDGNIPAMKGSHIPLVVMSIVALVVYVFPFTMLVLLAPWLQARSGYRLLRWVNKLKPLLDAYQGPYRDQFRYWTGLILYMNCTCSLSNISSTASPSQVLQVVARNDILWRLQRAHSKPKTLQV